MYYLPAVTLLIERIVWKMWTYEVKQELGLYMNECIVYESGMSASG